MWLIVTICLSATVSEILTSEVSKNDHVLFFAGGPDALNDLKFLSGVESFSIYQIPKNQISGTKKILIFFRDLGFDLQGHPRS